MEPLTKTAGDETRAEEDALPVAKELAYQVVMAAARDGHQAAKLVLMPFLRELCQLRDAARWRKCSEEKPTDGIEVLLADAQANPILPTLPPPERSHFWYVRPAHFNEDYSNWDHDNWNRPIDAKPDDFWLPLPRPQFSPLLPAPLEEAKG